MRLTQLPYPAARALVLEALQRILERQRGRVVKVKGGRIGGEVAVLLGSGRSSAPELSLIHAVLAELELKREPIRANGAEWLVTGVGRFKKWYHYYLLARKR
ncbi:MAG: hypothetical protein QXU69_08500 [Thermofilaceae archaeon]